MDSEELLAQLADIHLPEPVNFWPPAPGWWILALLLLIAAGFALRQLLALRTRKKICEYALAELDRCYQQLNEDSPVDLDERKLRYVNEVNSVLRRVALVHFPQSNVASLGGSAWVDFIREKGESSLLNEELATALAYGRFQTRCQVDADALHQMSRSWVRSLYLQSHTPDSQASGGGSQGSNKGSNNEDQPIHA